VEGWKIIFQENETPKEAEVVILIAGKIDLKPNLKG
jgi:hypothetical protein